MIKEFYREYVFQLSLIGLIIGAIFLLISTLGIFFNYVDFIKNNDFLQGIYDTIGNYIFWLFLGSLGLTIGCGFIFGDLMLKLQKFKGLISTESKATFVRNQNEIEELAWKLGPKYVDMITDKKRRFKIRK